MRPLSTNKMMLALLAGTILGIGCQTAPPIAPERKAAIASLKATYEDLKSTGLELESVNSDLDRAPITTDLASWYKDYTRSLDKLESAGRSTERQYWDLDKRRQAFEEAWDVEIAKNPDPQIQETMMQRKVRVAGAFDRVVGDARELRDSFKPYLTDLRAINSALKMDLSAGGINALKPALAKAKSDGHLVTEQLDKYSIELDRLRGRMAATKPSSMPATMMSAPPTTP